MTEAQHILVIDACARGNDVARLQVLKGDEWVDVEFAPIDQPVRLLMPTQADASSLKITVGTAGAAG